MEEAKKKRLKERVIEELRDLETVVQRMSTLYDQNPDLNDLVDISKIIPLSLDEWYCEIGGVIEEIEKEK